MKRYEHNHYDVGKCDFTEELDGGWVLWEDVDALLAQCEEALNESWLESSSARVTGMVEDALFAIRAAREDSHDK